ncbi:MAG: metal-sensitive transcriptional regulator [Candidatus Omnitrophica bacterium]|nr:metal-sensitive transcriptional regulator [Candidatus Omnitrophota bacterium]
MANQKKYLSRNQQIIALNRIEGQIGGIKHMIESGEYCVDVITQLHAVIGAILRVEDKILDRHLGTCVNEAFKNKTEKAKQKKIDEILLLLKRIRGRF